jgi:hypothetical protein
LTCGKSVYIARDKVNSMCDCEELEFEDFEVMLAALSKKQPGPSVEVAVQAPVPLVVAKQRK